MTRSYTFFPFYNITHYSYTSLVLMVFSFFIPTVAKKYYPYTFTIKCDEKGTQYNGMLTLRPYPSVGRHTTICTKTPIPIGGSWGGGGVACQFFQYHHIYIFKFFCLSAVSVGSREDFFFLLVSLFRRKERNIFACQLKMIVPPPPPPLAKNSFWDFKAFLVSN